MASRLEAQHAAEYAQAFGEVVEAVTRRIGGNEATTETVMAVVEIDSKVAGTPSDNGGLIDNERGKWTEIGALIEIPADQDESPQDTWLVRGQVWKQVGGPIGADGGSKTIQLVRRVGLWGRKPNTTTSRL